MLEVRPKPGLVGIVGAAGAGLAAAQAMQTRGVPYVVWEAGSGLGGRPPGFKGHGPTLLDAATSSNHLGCPLIGTTAR
jgi:monoamine oxidase